MTDNLARTGRLLDALLAIGDLELLENEPLSRHTSMGVGGPARLFAIPHSMPALENLLRVLNGGAAGGEPARWMMLGGGANTLFSDEGYHGVVVQLGRGFRAAETGPGPHQVTVGAAAQLSAVMNFCKREGLTGMEWAAGVPGTIGGSLAGNAGTPEGDMCSMAASVEVLDRAGQLHARPRGSFEFGYRWSALREDTILRAVLDLTPDDPEAIKARIDKALKKRGEQPIGKRCSGCMFKNPAGDYAGRLIDQAGLKGLSVGTARVSNLHANFIVNEGDASAGQIIELMERVRTIVREKTNIDLESEIRIVQP